MGRKELVVSALENGTVLDHIPAENVYKALDLLDLKGEIASCFGTKRFYKFGFCHADVLHAWYVIALLWMLALFFYHSFGAVSMEKRGSLPIGGNSFSQRA